MGVGRRELWERKGKWKYANQTARSNSGVVSHPGYMIDTATLGKRELRENGLLTDWARSLIGH